MVRFRLLNAKTTSTAGFTGNDKDHALSSNNCELIKSSSVYKRQFSIRLPRRICRPPHLSGFYDLQKEDQQQSALQKKRHFSFCGVLLSISPSALF
ncbi:MAG: hypothetical protein ACWGOX_02140 [Desulforhopalus sp.]